MEGNKMFTASDVCKLLIKDAEPSVYLREDVIAMFRAPVNDYSYNGHRNSSSGYASDDDDEYDSRRERESRINDIHSKYGYGTYIDKNEDLNAAEERAKTDEYLFYY